MKLKPVRIGLWDQYGGSMPSGWTRWLFEQYEFPFEVVFPGDARRRQPEREVRRAGVRRRRHSRARRRRRRRRRLRRRSRRPTRSRRSSATGWDASRSSKTVPELKKFVENGGTVLTIGSSTALGHHLGLPIRDALVERVADGAERPLPREKFYVPGLDSRGAHRQHAAARLRHGRARDGVLRREPGVPAAAGGGAEGREAGGVVRQPDAAAQRLGVGPAVSRSGGVDRRGAGRQGPRRAVRQRGELARRSRTARSSCCSTASTTAARRHSTAPGARTTDQPIAIAAVRIAGRVCASAHARPRCASRCPSFVRDVFERQDASLDPDPALQLPGRHGVLRRLNVQRLWTMDDGTICLLVEREDAPRYEICVVRGERGAAPEPPVRPRQRADAGRDLAQQPVRCQPSPIAAGGSHALRLATASARAPATG